jgi:hypothetical protein
VAKQESLSTGRSDVQDILTLIQAHYEPPKRQYFKSIAYYRNEFFENIQLEELPDLSCLACSKYFFYCMNIMDDSVNKTPVADCGSVKELQSKDNREMLRKEVCALLNSEGGVIVFNVRRVDRSLLAIGSQIPEY